MRQIQISDVRKRLHSLSQNNRSNQCKSFINEEARNAIVYKRLSDIKRFIESAGKKDVYVSFSTIINHFDTLAEIGNTSDITKMGSFIANEVTIKYKDTSDLQSILSKRISILESKPLRSSNTNRYNAIKNAYETIQESVIIYSNCDRMLENYNNISKRFNLEILINENTKINGVIDTVVELCNRIDTYDIPDNVKFNTIIETALYGFESNYIDYNKSDIIETAVNYFAFKKNGLQSCKSILL